MVMARMRNPPHPVQVLREFLPDAMTIEEVARRLGVSRVQLSRILNARSAIQADMAIRVGLLIHDCAHGNLLRWVAHPLSLWADMVAAPGGTSHARATAHDPRSHPDATTRHSRR